MKEQAAPLRRAYLVLSNEIQADLENLKDKNPKSEMKMVLHSVFFGKEKDMKAIEETVKKLKEKVRRDWRIMI